MGCINNFNKASSGVFTRGKQVRERFLLTKAFYAGKREAGWGVHTTLLLLMTPFVTYSKSMSSFSSSSGNDFFATHILHSGTEAMLISALSVTGLKRPL